MATLELPYIIGNPAQLAVSLVDWKDSTAIFTTVRPLIRIFDAPRQSASSLKENYRVNVSFCPNFLPIDTSMFHRFVNPRFNHRGSTIISHRCCDSDATKKTTRFLKEKLFKICQEIFASHLRATIKAEDTLVLARAFICGATKQPRE